MIKIVTGRNPADDRPLLGSVVDCLIAVDPTVENATTRQRDGRLFGLWLAIGEQSTLDRVRGRCSPPSYRRELTVLARNSVGPTSQPT
ncbi:hypothetical protein ACPESR_11970 [Nocardia testacea]|uniref:hypothetical protein n=1 Tax=Nocardia testacea TaxID=248551 RepID=UPI003C2D6B7F